MESLSAQFARARQRLPAPVQDALDDLEGQDIPFLAAGLAFYALVSVAPLVVLAFWLTSLIAGDSDVHRTAEQIARVLPHKLGIDKAMVRVADTGSDLGVWAALAALWPATAYGAGLARGFHRLSGKGRRPEGLWGRVLSLALVIVLQVFVWGALVLATIGPRLVGDGALPAALGWALGLAAGFLAVATASAVIYWLYVPESVTVRDTVMGACITAGGVTILSLACVLLLNLGTNFERRYASSGLAAVVLLALWLFLANALLLTSYRIISLRD
jgi:uncharacterized BrkB/YihY/UPF0761 family membrane protein